MQIKIVERQKQIELEEEEITRVVKSNMIGSEEKSRCRSVR